MESIGPAEAILVTHISRLGAKGWKIVGNVTLGPAIPGIAPSPVTPTCRQLVTAENKIVLEVVPSYSSDRVLARAAFRKGGRA